MTAGKLVPMIRGTRLRTISLLVSGSLLTMAVAGIPASAYPRPGTTQRVSVASDGTEAGAEAPFFARSVMASLSASGRYVAFDSIATNLVDNDTNLASDVFVHDTRRRKTERVSVPSDGTQGLGGSSEGASISANGRWVAFTSAAPNLVRGDTNLARDVFVHDRQTRTTTRVSVGPSNRQANEASPKAAISSDGRYVAFESRAGNLVGNDGNGTSDVFVHDRTTAKTERVSVSADGGDADGGSLCPSLSRNGRFVSFSSGASNIAETPGGIQVFLHDRRQGTSELVSAPIGGAPYRPERPLEPSSSSCVYGGRSVSYNGRYVVFSSRRPDLVPNDANGTPAISYEDVFVRDRKRNKTERVSVGPAGEEIDWSSFDHSISGDGRFVVFASEGTNLPPEEPNESPALASDFDVFLHDHHSGATERLSIGAEGEAASRNGGDADSTFPVVNADGRFVAWQSDADNLVPRDDDHDPFRLRVDIFVRDRGRPLAVGGFRGKGDGVRLSPGGMGSSRIRRARIADDEDDALGSPMGPAGELVGADVIRRPALGDLLVRLRPKALPLPPELWIRTAGAVFGATFSIDGQAYELRSVTSGGQPVFGLFSCDPARGCSEVARLAGGFGTTGHEITMSVPLSVLEAERDSELTEFAAFSAIGTYLSGPVTYVDVAAL